MGDVAQVLIYLIGVSDIKTVDLVYREFFSAPYPNRSGVAVAALGGGRAPASVPVFR